MQRIAQVAAGLVSIIGLVVLVGWYVGAGWLTTDFPHFASMAPNTALAIIALGLGVTMGDRPRLALALGAFVVGIGGTTLLEYALDPSFGIDNALPGIDLVDARLARMSPATAAALVLLGGSVIATVRGRASLVRGLAIVAFGVGYVAVLGHLFDVEALYATGGYRSMAAHTAACIAIVSAGFLVSDDEAGLVGLWRDRGGAGHLLRALAPFLLIGPLAMGWSLLWAERAGWFDISLGVAILATAVTVSGGAFTWRVAVTLRLVDRQRTAATAALAESHRTLETTVTERTNALAEANQRLSTLIRVAPVGIIELDADGGLLEANPEWEALSGLSEQDSQGEGWGAAVHPDDLERIGTEWSAAVAAQRDYATTLRLVTPAGKVNAIQAANTPIRGEDGVLTGFVSTVMDVTALVAAREAVMATNARMSTLIDLVPVAIIELDVQGGVVAVNEYSQMLSGRMQPDETGAGWLDSLHPDDDDRVRTEWGASVAAGLPYDTTCRLVTPEGKVNWIQGYTKPIRNADDVVTGHMAALMGVTELVAARDAAAAAKDQLSTLIQLVPVGIVELDAEGGLLTANKQMSVLSGRNQEDSLGAGWSAAMHPEDADRVGTEWRAAVAAGRAYDTNLRLVTGGGKVNWVQAFTTPVRSVDDVVTGHLAAVMDVTALRDAQDRALRAIARFHSAFASSPLGTALVSLDGEVLEANRRLAQLTGRSTGALQGEQAENLFEPHDLPDHEPWFDALMDGTMASHRRERQLRLGEGAETWVDVSVAVIRHEDQLQGLIYEFADVTARRLAETRAEAALYDSLTKLPNRLLLLDRLRQSLLEAARRGRGVGVLFIDLDRFKVVNDSLGHHAGDVVLTEVAARLKGNARASDTVARVGGDEFVVVCPDVENTEDVLQIAVNMREAVAKPIRVGDQIAEVDASIGVAFGVGHDDPEALLQSADQAMYHAKDRGRARYAVFDSDLRRRLERRLDTELGLRTAVERGEIESWYQPIVDLHEPAVVANEALARWRRPDLGIVMPGTFISIAEETGLIRDLGETVLTQACCAAAAVPDGPAVSVNVSARQFVRHDFGAIVERALSLAQLPPHRLWLELTESNAVQAIDSAARTFQSLRERGVLLAIDDFGTGFSSFEHLRTFSVDILKIDMSFVHDLVRSDRDRAIVEGILRLADALHLDVVAEGVETAAQRDLLRDLGCRFGQGYLFGRPSPIAAPAAIRQAQVPSPW